MSSNELPIHMTDDEREKFIKELRKNPKPKISYGKKGKRKSVEVKR